MGSENLIAGIPPTLSGLWSRLPIQPSPEDAGQVLRALSTHLASVLGCAEPQALMAYGASPGDSWIAESLPPSLCTPDVLGAAWERMMNARDRRTQGSHFTPRAVADRVVGLATSELELREFDRPLRVWDPAAGGGAFLLAAARAAERSTGTARGDIVRSLYASDIDSVALAVCDASLELWARGSGRIETSCCDALLDLDPSWPNQFDLVVGNPPFLGQLSQQTSRAASRRARLRSEYDEVAAGYVDEAGLFLHLALSRSSSSGVVALILPESLLAARDSKPLREACERSATLNALWVDEGQSFEAAVDVVAPIFVRSSPLAADISVVVGDRPSARMPRPQAASWSALLASARGVPRLDLDGSIGVVADKATATAGFRQHFYGIATAVRDSSSGPPDGSGKPEDIMQLVTSGAIDPLRPGWGLDRVKFAGTTWRSPELHLSQIEDESVRLWFTSRRQPKLLLATQTRVLEVVVDETGSMAPSVPVIAVEPFEVDDLWLLAAVFSSPAASAWMAARAAGTGLSQSAIRVRASELSQIPLPIDETSWQRGARAAEAAQQASQVDDGAAYAEAMGGLARSMSAAYGGVDDAVNRWWWDGLRMPPTFAARHTEGSI